MALKKGLEIKNVNTVFKILLYVFKRQIYSHLAQKEKKSVVQFSKWIFAYLMQGAWEVQDQRIYGFRLEKHKLVHYYTVAKNNSCQSITIQ